MKPSESKKDIAGMNNLIGYFCQLLAAGRGCEAPSLFVPDETAQFVYNGVKHTGRQAVDEFFSKWGAASDTIEWHLTHSPSLRITLDTACAAWDLYSFRIRPQTGRFHFAFGHIVATFTRIAEKLLIQKLQWDDLQQMSPEHCDPMPVLDMSLTAAPGEVSDEDWYELRNLVGLFAHSSYTLAPALFAPLPDVRISLQGCGGTRAFGYEDICESVSHLAVERSTRQGEFFYVPMLASPVIDINENTASGRWLCMGFSVCRTPDDSLILTRTLDETDVSFIKHIDRWMLKDYRQKTALTLSSSLLYPTKRYNRIQFEYDPWVYGPENRGVCSCEDMLEIEEILSDWVHHGWGRSTAGAFLQENLLGIETAIPIMHLNGSTRVPTVGKVAISSRMDPSEQRSDLPMYNLKNKLPAYHTGNTPAICVYDNWAEASWFDFAAVNLGGLMGLDELPVRYMPSVGKYHHRFVRENGRWRLYDFGWDPLIALPEWEYDPTLTEGWVSYQTGDFRLPDVFQMWE